MRPFTNGMVFGENRLLQTNTFFQSKQYYREKQRRKKLTDLIQIFVFYYSCETSVNCCVISEDHQHTLSNLLRSIYIQLTRRTAFCCATFGLTLRSIDMTGGLKIKWRLLQKLLTNLLKHFSLSFYPTIDEILDSVRGNRSLRVCLVNQIDMN